MNRKRIALTIASLIVAITLGFVLGEKKEGTALSSPVVRTYQVPAKRAEEVRNILSKLFWQKDGDTNASAQVFGNGLLIVRAPEGFQGGVTQLISKLSDDSSQERRERIRISYWLVLGETASKSNVEEFGELTPVLSSIDKVDGPRKFRILEHLGSTSLNGTETRIKGNFTELKIHPRAVDNEVMLEVYANSHTGEINASTAVKPGEFIVLGQNALRIDSDVLKLIKPSENWAENPPNLYHVIRAEPLQ